MSQQIIHQCPPEGSGLLPCCGKTPFEVPRTDRITADASNVTCGKREAMTIDRKQLREAAFAATPGLWTHLCAPLRRGMAMINEVQDSVGRAIVLWAGFDNMDRTKKQNKANARFISRANPATVLALLDELDAKDVAIETIRDSILHERYQMAEGGFTGDQVNSVLGIIDDHWPQAARKELGL